MLPHRVLASPLLWFLLHLQAHPGLFCTFKLTNEDDVSWAYIVRYPFVYSRSHGGCLKMCLEDYPDCSMVGVLAEDSNDFPSTQVNISNFKYRCTIFVTESSPNNFGVSYDPSVILYKLEREEVDVKCPLAVDVFP